MAGGDAPRRPYAGRQRGGMLDDNEALLDFVPGVPVRVRGAVRADLQVRPRPPGCRHRAAGRLHPDRCAHAGDGRPRPPAAAAGDRRPVPSGRNSRAWGGAGRRKAGAADFIEKPYDDQVLLATVRAEFPRRRPALLFPIQLPEPDSPPAVCGRGLPCALSTAVLLRRRVVRCSAWLEATAPGTMGSSPGRSARAAFGPLRKSDTVPGRARVTPGQIRACAGGPGAVRLDPRQATTSDAPSQM